MTDRITSQLFPRAADHGTRRAIVAPDGEYAYDGLLDRSARVAAALLTGAADLEEARVAFLVPAGLEYPAVQWGIWRAGGLAVPLCVSHPPAELDYVLEDSQASIVIAHPDLAERVKPLAADRGLRYLTTLEVLAAGPAERLLQLPLQRRAMMVYTSGTTGRPKGVVTTHGNIEAQVTALVEAWGWTADDRILSVLPLHHVHGIVNVLTCALWSGATCEFLPRFDPEIVWDRLAAGDLTLFMAVPTIYRRLINTYEQAAPPDRARMTSGCRKLRLMVSGSAALPVNTLERWREISGHTLLERYGMTEIGMALSNSLEGERIPGSVGRPLPEVEVKLIDETGSEVDDGTPGEILVRGPAVFAEYWNRPVETEEAFSDGWFKTGDIAEREDGVYRIMGRNSVDIINTGGFKVSALEVEEVLRAHAAVADCAVVGTEDPDWGECVVAVIELSGANLTLDEVKLWCGERLAPYKIPRTLHIVDALPRNAMGKVVKPEIADLIKRAG
ncbi:MAG: acyl-CoA synthetase [Gemmatimonadales bacterium]